MKKLIIALLVLIALGAGGYWGLLPAYRGWKQERLVNLARKSLDEGDPRAAMLSARQVLAMNSANLEACRIMAEITERMRSPAALQWRERIVELDPQSVSNRFQLARSAILHGKWGQAAKALNGIAETNRSDATFHHLAAMIAVGLKNLPLAEAHFGEAARLNPSNKVYQLNRAVLRLQAKDEAIVQGALQTLEQLYQDPQYHKDALRNLAMATLHNKDYDKAIAFTREIQAATNASFADKLIHLTALKEGGSDEFTAYLDRLKNASNTNAAAVGALTTWLIGRDMTTDATAWIATLPEQTQSSPIVMLARVDCCIAQADWPGLQALVEGDPWKQMEFIRRATLSKALREQGQVFAAQSEWLAAMKSASEQPRQLTMLAKLAEKWEWGKEFEDVLWTITERFPGERWALESLNARYYKSGKTRGLHKVYSLLTSYDADNMAAKNNLAAVSLLLGLPTTPAEQLSREAYTRHPTNESFASTHAYALVKQGRNKEALDILDALEPSQLESPSVALYYAIVLMANGQTNRAREFMTIAQTARLLPEETVLLEDLKRAL